MLFHKKNKEEPPKEEKEEKEKPAATPVPINITVNSPSNNAEPASAPAQKKDGKAIFVKVVSILLIAAVTVGVVFAFIGLFQKKSGKNSNEFILLQGKSYAQSQKAYSAFGTADSNKSKRKKLQDVEVIGNKLFVSESKITPSLLSSEHQKDIVSGDYDGLGLYNLTTDNVLANRYGMTFTQGTYFIDLNQLGEGDYLIYPLPKDYVSDSSGKGQQKANLYPYSLAKEESFFETVYSLPKEDGTRRRITLKNNSISPYFVISVENCGSVLPNGYYDAVIYRNQFELDEDRLIESTPASDAEMASLEEIKNDIHSNTNFQVQAVRNISEASKTNATLAIAFSNEITDNYASVFTYSHYEGFLSKVIESGELTQYDLYPEIRELTGRIDHAGEGYAEVIGNNILDHEVSSIGKESFLLAGYRKNQLLEGDSDSAKLISLLDILKS